ncbi:MAG: hypothetical protein IJG64_05725 [Oscillospiraceae bacterium]|nr:hypothetical protein [Oscillospiraceae bacterium]
MKKRIAFTAALAALMTFLSSCTRFSSADNIMELLSSPKLSKNESRIVQAISDHLDRDIFLRYPKRETRPSPVQLVDLNGDGTNEAVALYSCPSLGGNARIAVLTANGEEWTVFRDNEGLGSEFYDIAFEPLEKDRDRKIIVSYTFSDYGEKILTIYSLSDEGSLDTDAFNCQGYIVRDITGDGVSDIVYAGVNANNQYTRLNIITNDPSIREDAVLSWEIPIPNSRVTNIAYTRTDYSPLGAIIIDYYDTFRMVYTQAFSRDENGLVERMPNNLVQKVWRADYPLSGRDVDRDGYVETPTVIDTELARDSDVCFMEWTNFMKEEPVRKLFGVCDIANGIYYRLPEEWQDLVYVQRDDNGHLCVRRVDTDEEIIRFEILPPGEADAGENEVIVTKGMMRTRLSFDPSVSTIQKNYISTRFFSIKQ